MASPERPGESQSLVLSKPYAKRHRGLTFRLERLKYFFQLYIQIDVRSGHLFKGKQGKQVLEHRRHMLLEIGYQALENEELLNYLKQKLTTVL